MSSTKQEVVAATIGKQIAYLEGLLKELESDPERTPLFRKKIRDVENELNTLRSRLGQ